MQDLDGCSILGVLKAEIFAGKKKIFWGLFFYQIRMFIFEHLFLTVNMGHKNFIGFLLIKKLQALDFDRLYELYNS